MLCLLFCASVRCKLCDPVHFRRPQRVLYQKLSILRFSFAPQHHDKLHSWFSYRERLPTFYCASCRAFCTGLQTRTDFTPNSKGSGAPEEDEFDEIFSSQEPVSALDGTDLDEQVMSSERCGTEFPIRLPSDFDEPHEATLNPRDMHAKSFGTLCGSDLEELNKGLESLRKVTDKSMRTARSRNNFEALSKSVGKQSPAFGLKKDHTKLIRASHGNDNIDDDGNEDDNDADYDVCQDDDDEGGIIDGHENEPFLVENLLNTKVSNRDKDLGDPDRPLWRRIEEAAPAPLRNVIKTWVKDGNPLNRPVIVCNMMILRKRKKFSLALELSDWITTERPYDLDDKDFGARLHLIARVSGMRKAKEYFNSIPLKYRTGLLYSVLVTLLVSRNVEVEALRLVEKVEKKGLGHLTYMYNQLLFLYKKNGYMKGVMDVLQAMDDKKIPPDIYTYNILLDMKARKGDVEGMEKLWDHMLQDKSVEPDLTTYASLAKGYCAKGMVEKAIEAARKVEDIHFQEKRKSMCIAMRIYGDVGKKEEVERIWNSLVKSRPKVSVDDYVSMLQAIGKAAGIEQAEEYFREMERNIGINSIHQYNSLLQVYSLWGLVEKGEKLMKKIVKLSIHPNASTYHQLIHMYLKAGDALKAMETLKNAQKASRTSLRNRPMWQSFQVVLDYVAEKGDVKKAEMIMREIRKAGYSVTYRAYASLLQAYKAAGISPYGFMDRLRADNVYPGPGLRNTVEMLEGT